ncbi:UBX domain-containing protein 2A [Amia ocellicauda]|uniref:UBX domain-containing protein 2A n=1 Tax=Amia ocellicauda TaxID=2972642 RepID=UPI003463CF6D
MKNINNTEENSKDREWGSGAESCEEEAPISRSFSVEDLLDEVEKIGTVSAGDQKAELVVKLWKDGFTVNDEGLRNYTDEENQQFLESIKRGQLPLEFERVCMAEELEVKVEDLKEEMYKPRRKTFHPFTGRGYRLGSVAPKVITKSLQSQEDSEGLPIPSVELSDVQPVTSLQIWLADGRRLVQKFNLSHRISDVREFIERSHGTDLPFILTTSLPLRELTEDNCSLLEADLSNAVIVQRPVKAEAPFGQS